jgi:predicted type IV restriction endonuclease
MSLNSSRNCAITEFETANGPADYALCADGVILGIVEAKKVSLVFFRNEVLVVQNDIEKRTMNLQAALAIVNEA